MKQTRLPSGQVKPSRRQFLGTAAAASTAAVVSGGYWVNPTKAEASKSPNEKLNIAIVGTGNKGWHNVEQLTSENIVALCDVDTRFLDRASEVHSSARKFRDYRKMMDEFSGGFDAVVVSTADHTHAPASSIALSLDKHVYCEKPLAHTVQEARTLARLAKEHGVATQMGTQIHATGNYRRVVELIQSGAIGKVTSVYNWCNKGWSDGRFSSETTPVPANLDWDLWLGPAAERPYSPSIHPGDWRRFWEYGSGTFGDMACHVMDLPFWALNLGYPTSVKCEGPDVHPDGAPAWVKASYQFVTDDGEIDFHWSDGGAHFDLVKETADADGRTLDQWGLGILFVGESGMLAADYGRRLLLPVNEFEDFTAPEQTIPDSIGHWNEWVHACKTGDPTTCNFQYSGALTETVLLGIVAFRAGEELQWDAEMITATNCDEAEAYVKKEYRSGFEVVGIM